MDICRSIGLGFLVFCFTEVLAQEPLTIIEGPSNVTAPSGSDVILSCTVDVNNTEVVEWFEYVSRSTGVKIYSSAEGLIGDPDKYEVNIEAEGTFHLTVKRANTSDGGLYGCITDDSVSSAIASVVLLDPLEMVLEEAMLAEESYIVTCNVTFGSHLLSDIHPGQVPYTEAGVGDQTVPSSSETINIGRNTYAHVMEVNYTARAADHRLELICTVSTTEPPYQQSIRQELNIYYMAQDVNISPTKAVYGVGETVRCHVDSNPPSQYEWFPTRSAYESAITGPDLTFTREMLGSNTWRCTATYNITDSSLTAFLGPITVEHNDCNGRTYFSAHLDHNDDYLFANGEVIPYNDVYVNCGGAYNPQTGIFTCPKDGYYELFLYVQTHTAARLASVRVAVDGTQIFNVYSPVFDTPSSGTAFSIGNSMVVYCGQGSTIWAEQSAEAGSLLEDCCAFNSFTITEI